jgi:BirA family biotin operon repressor/biotin-[acetyl-CoA-carboxylase] ligase
LSPATPNIVLGAPLIELSTIDSTNIYAMAQIKAGLSKSGSCYTADFQTNGKGQHGRVWESSKGQNLLCSYILELNTLDTLKNWTPADQIGFSAAIALGIRAFFDAHTNGDTKIKRPNDIYWRDRKAGGILIENLLKGTEWTWAVVGIGININQTVFSPEAPNPVSLKQITGRDWDILSLQEALSKALTKSIQDWLMEGEEKTFQAFDAACIEIK